MSSKPAHRKAAGLSMVELVMFIVIVGIAVVSVLQVLGIGARTSPDPMRRKQALAIAESMMEEVRLAHFTFCDGNDPMAEDPSVTATAGCNTPETVGPADAGGNPNRPYDNVNDYVTAFGNGAGAAVIYSTDAAGNAFPAGYTATVSINPDPAFGPAGALIVGDATAAGMNVLRITVRVSYNGGDDVVLDGYRTRYAPRSL
ncbi:type IV pilus modification PilV family protein [Rugamonas rivuli]|uniref:Type II secretion system protein n=1 Tax=Rugamonas rivuli TaxID=2743358 RepID=A0A843S8W1_9BURK|nr:hypothetical protein [Rugamonas rivuli]MQA18888.1 hypothetical protein [Rugamonas rivuli]